MGSLLLITHGFCLQLSRGSIAIAIPKSASSNAEIKLTTFLSGLASRSRPGSSPKVLVSKTHFLGEERTSETASCIAMRSGGHFLLELARFSHSALKKSPEGEVSVPVSVSGCYGPRLTGLSPGFQPGFNPGNLEINEFALKGREADLIKLAPIAAPKNRVRNRDMLQLDLLSRF